MRACARLFHAYERECHRQRFLDFDDLVRLAVRLLEQKPEVRRSYAGRYPHVLVDEYQDLNLAQERLVELVAGGGDPFVVGDDDQSIYRFRGASRASLERFLGSFPMARTVTLGRNRRSSRRIVSAASALIANNLDRLPKQLRAEAGGPAVQAWEAADRLDVRDLFFELMEQTGYLAQLRAGLEASEAARATANVSRFAEMIAEFCESSPDHSLVAYMRHLDLVLLSGEDAEPAPVEATDAIQVMTIHQSKGLEFEVVFVPSLVEGRLPQSGRSPRFELPPAVVGPLVRGPAEGGAQGRRVLGRALARGPG